MKERKIICSKHTPRLTQSTNTGMDSTITCKSCKQAPDLSISKIVQSFRTGARTQKGSYLSTMPHAWLIKRLNGFINKKKLKLKDCQREEERALGGSNVTILFDIYL